MQTLAAKYSHLFGNNGGIEHVKNRNYHKPHNNQSHKEIEEQAEANHANCVVDFVCFFEELFHNREIILQFQIIVKLIFEILCKKYPNYSSNNPKRCGKS